MKNSYNHRETEKRIYQMWENGGYFRPKIDPNKKPYTIIQSLPNASGKMHIGNVLMLVIQDILVRYHRMKGDPTLWLPGSDHGGYETQITYEKMLEKEGKTRFHFTRKQLYDQIWDFTQKNQPLIKSQIKSMGASVDWDRYGFTLDEKSIKTVYNTFRKMIKDELIYRGEYLVNYCPDCGTTLSDIELSQEKRVQPLYHIKYPVITRPTETYLLVSTPHPESLFATTHLLVNPEDERVAAFIGEKVQNPFTGIDMPIIADTRTSSKCNLYLFPFSPSTDKNDYEFALINNLPIDDILDWEGKFKKHYIGHNREEARKKAVEELQGKNLLERVHAEYQDIIDLCKRGHTVEQIILLNWFINVDTPDKSLKKPALDAVKNGDIVILPRWRQRTYLKWMEHMRDWPISRQNAWGITIPVWYEITDPSHFTIWFIDKNKTQQSGNLQVFLNKGYSLDEIKNGLERVYADRTVNWVLEDDKEPEKEYLPETDTFDTWFSASHWTLSALGYPDHEDYRYFYPTDIWETGWDLLLISISRKIMFGYYLTGQASFNYVFCHKIILGLDGQKMSKSKGNIIYPEDYIEQYGTDALRMGLISQIAKFEDFVFPKEEVINYRKFIAILWEMGRFMQFQTSNNNLMIKGYKDLPKEKLTFADQKMLQDVQWLAKSVANSLEKFQFTYAADKIDRFMSWKLDNYMKQIRYRKDQEVTVAIAQYVYVTCLKLLHPFMPFVTEEIYGILNNGKERLIVSEWPSDNDFLKERKPKEEIEVVKL